MLSYLEEMSFDSAQADSKMPFETAFREEELLSETLYLRFFLFGFGLGKYRFHIKQYT